MKKETLFSNDEFTNFLKKLGFKKCYTSWRTDIYYTKDYVEEYIEDNYFSITANIEIRLEDGEDENGEDKEYASIQPCWPQFIDDFDSDSVTLEEVEAHVKKIEDTVSRMKADLFAITNKVRELNPLK